MGEFFRWFFRAKSPNAQRARWVSKLILLLVLFIILFWIVPVEQVIQAILNANPYFLLLGVFLGLISVVLTSFQMEPLTRNQGIKHGVGKILAINLAVRFYLQFTPSTLIASGFRVYKLAQPDGKVVESLVALTFYRAIETFLTLAMGLTFFLLAGQQVGIEVSLGWLLLIMVGIIVTWLFVTRYSLRIFTWFEGRQQTSKGQGQPKLLFRRIGKFLTAVSAYAHMPAKDLILSISAGILSAMAGIVSGVYLARAIGIDLDFLNMGWIQSILLIATQLPFTIAGGLGVREVTLVALLANFDISPDLAIALSFLMFFRGIFISILGGVVEGVDLFRSRRMMTGPPGESGES